MKITIAYFSATNTTKSIVTEIAHSLSDEMRLFNVTSHSLDETVLIPANELLLIGMPVYGGRIPSIAVDSLKRFKGAHTPVILVAVYGNREFEDAFVEMQDIVETNGFFVLAAGAFIAQHSIFPHTANGRPDSADHVKIKEFAKLCSDAFDKGFSKKTESISLPGNRPYKIPGNIPLKVKTNSNCTECHTCIQICPVQAIPKDNPYSTDYEKCIHCGRCISNCSVHARHYEGILYRVAGALFGWKNRKRKEPQFFF